MRQQMHPKIAATVPNTPEALAILNERLIIPRAFGGLVTKLVEHEAVDATSMDVLRTSVSEVLGIEENEFDEHIADFTLLEDDTVWRWHDNYKKKAEDELVKVKYRTVQDHFSELVEGRIGNGNTDKLQPRITEAAAKVDELEQQVAEFTEKGLEFRAIPPRLMLEKVRKPELEALKTSRYAISLADLTEMLQSDPLILEHGEEFAEEVVTNFAYSLNEKSKILPEPWWLTSLFKGETDYLGEEEMKTLQNTWLSEKDVALLAQSYSWAYYAPLGKNVPGRSEMEALTNPIRQAMFVSEQERADFFERFPLANGTQPGR